MGTAWYSSRRTAILSKSIRASHLGKTLIERPRARRYPFHASIDLVDMSSEIEIREQTTDLSVFGCQVTAQKVLPTDTKVHLRIIHRGAIFAAQGQITNVHGNSMGVVFTRIEQKDQAVLENWLAEARDTYERTTSAH
jgi:hypothetical protein